MRLKDYLKQRITTDDIDKAHQMHIKGGKQLSLAITPVHASMKFEYGPKVSMDSELAQSHLNDKASSAKNSILIQGQHNSSESPDHKKLN